MSKSSSKCPSVQVLTTCFYLTWRLFFFKGGLGLVFLSNFLHDFWRKIFLTLYAIKWLNLIAWLPLLLEILGNMCIIITCSPVCHVKKFEIKSSFLIKPFSYMIKTSGQRKELLKWSKNHFSKFLKGFQLL